jgi:SAM-dependent methyltransferase
MRICPACGSTRCSVAWGCEDCGARPSKVDGFISLAPETADHEAGFDESFFAELADLEAKNFWFRARNALIVWAMRTYAPDCSRFLEIGCGTGFVLAAIRSAYPDAELVGSELFSRGLGFAAARVPSAEFLQMDARDIPFREHFDAIGAFDVLEHIEDDGAVIATVARALRPGGHLFVTVPQHPALWSPQDDVSLHVRRYTAAGIRAKLRAAGFAVVRTTSFVSLLLPLMLGARLSMRGRPSEDPFETMSGLRVPAPADALLAAVMGVERALIRHGVSWPAGGSLLVVARTVAGSGTDR